MTAATPGQALCGHEHEHGGIAYRCERKPHPVNGHEEWHRHAARIDAGYAREIGDVDGDGTPDLLTWEGDESGDGDNTEIAWGTVAALDRDGLGPVTAATPGQAAYEAYWANRDDRVACLAKIVPADWHDERSLTRAAWEAAAQAVLDQAFPGLRRQADEARAEAGRLRELLALFAALLADLGEIAARVGLPL